MLDQQTGLTAENMSHHHVYTFDYARKSSSDCQQTLDIAIFLPPNHRIVCYKFSANINITNEY